MKSDSIFFFWSVFIAITLIMASKREVNQAVYVDQAVGPINKKFQVDLSSFYKETVNFHEMTIAFQEKEVNESTLKVHYSNLREKFKIIEFFLEYLDEEAFNKALNGAPLPKLEKKVADLTILEPKGMQVIDELIVANLSEKKAKNKLVISAEKLVKDTKSIYQFLEVRRVTDRQFFEATSQCLIRMATLGISGFDTPGTAMGVSDASIVLNNLEDYMSFYKVELDNVGRSHLLSDFKRLTQTGFGQTSKTSFENLNRLLFLKEVVHPLLSLTKEIHLALDYETIDEVSRYAPAVNYKAQNLFEKDFLNTFYYVSIAKDTNFSKVATLGKLLFYDPVLSLDNTMACASCHAPEKAFTDGLTTSRSNTGEPLQRNALTLNYSVYASGFFYDLRTKRLEDQFEHVVLSEHEFNTSYPVLLKKLAGSPTYTDLFIEAFPQYQNPIKSNNLDYALTAYVMGLNSFNSPVDQYFQGKLSSLPTEVENGFNLFSGKANCASCHFLPTFSGLAPPFYKDSEAEVLGVPEHALEPWILDDDLGRLGNGVTQEVAYFYKNAFKTPTIRNIQKTAPYMHNGVFTSLKEVLTFYNEGGGVGRGLILGHQTLSSDPLDLSQEEMDDIIAFMNALTDTTTEAIPEHLPRDFKTDIINKRRRTH